MDEQTSHGLAEALHQLFQQVHALNRRASAAMGIEISPTAFRILGLVNDRPRRIGDLAKAVGISQPGTTKVVNALEADHLVERTTDPEDSRAAVVSATADGQQRVARRLRELATHLRPQLGELSPQDVGTLTRAAEILARATKDPAPHHPTALPAQD